MATTTELRWWQVANLTFPHLFSPGWPPVSEPRLGRAPFSEQNMQNTLFGTEQQERELLGPQKGAQVVTW